MTGSPSRLSTIGGSWSVIVAPGPSWPRSRIRRAGAEAPRSHLASKMGPRQEQWRRWISRHHSPNRAAEVSVGRCPGWWERIWERVLLRGALPCFTPLPMRPFDLRGGTSMQATAFGIHSWGSRGRRFKSGRPDQKVQVRRGTGFLLGPLSDLREPIGEPLSRSLPCASGAR
jgi:hypothetical protein